MHPFDTYREELRRQGLSTREDLLQLVRPLLREATRLEIKQAVRKPAHTQLRSHFGGDPYFDPGELWPLTEEGRPLDFIFQLVNTGDLGLPPSIRLLQFYYDWKLGPWESAEEGWLVRTYTTLTETPPYIERPASLGRTKYCEIAFSRLPTLPDWEGLEEHSPIAMQLSSVLDEDAPWAPYEAVVQELVGEQSYRSQLGGYPKWVQAAATPENDEGRLLPLLFQLDSEAHANLMWGDTGLVYVFHDPDDAERFEFQMQSL